MADRAGLWHAMLGENEKPKSKIDAFARALRTWSGNKPRLAFLKLCFVDVTETTDIADLLQYYRARMTELKTEFPEVSFGHVTVPLAPQSSTLKATIKRAIGRRIPEDVANVARTRYNAQLRALFANEPIFDLEEVESTRADGTKVQLATASGPAVGLAPEFASDGWGHLNERGAARAAFALAKFLVSSTQPAAVTQNRSTGAAQ